MCKYCNNEKDISYLSDENGFEVFIDEIGDSFKIDILYNGVEDMDEVFIPINYCPMCGEKV